MSRSTLAVRLGFGLVVVAAGALSWKVLSADDEPAPRKLAFLVGVKAYDHPELKKLEFTENDVDELARVLTDQGFKVTVLTTARGRSDAAAKPTAANIRERLQQ